MKDAPVVVLGAGCAGLAAAWRLRSLGFPVVVVEEQDHPGGLSGGVRINGNVYEYGPHVFHTTDPRILADVKELMGGDLLPFERTIQIRFLGNYFKFPLSIPEVLFKLPARTVISAMASLAHRFVQGALVKPEVENSETVLRRYYGDVLYKIFFKDYIERVWGIAPAQFSPAFARERIPRLNILDVMDKAAALARRQLGRAVRTDGYVEKVEGELYTTRHGFSMITQRMADRLTAGGAQILYDAKAVRLARQGNRLTGVAVRRAGREETVACSAVVNTLPINETALAITPGMGPEVEQAAARLRFRATVFVGIKAARPQVLRASFMYFREHVFNRVTDLSFFGHKIEPEGCTLLVAEVNCDPEDRVWSDEALVKEAVGADLEREGLLSRADIREMHIFRSRHAYPIYALGYEAALASLLARLGALENFETAGRQGRFQYINTHVAMKMGYEAADRLHGRFGNLSKTHGQ